MSSGDEFEDAISVSQSQDVVSNSDASTKSKKNAKKRKQKAKRQQSEGNTNSPLDQLDQQLPGPEQAQTGTELELVPGEPDLAAAEESNAAAPELTNANQLQDAPDTEQDLVYDLIDIELELVAVEEKTTIDATSNDNNEQNQPAGKVKHKELDPPLPDRKPIADILRLDQIDAVLLGQKSNNLTKIKQIQYDKHSSNYLLQAKFNQLNKHYKSLDQKQKDAINSGTENIKNTFNSIKQTVGGFDEMFASKIDWEFWEKIVNDYEQVIVNDSDHLNTAIISGIPREFRGIIWQLIAKSKNFQLEEFYFHLKQETSVHEKSIKRDLSRTSFFTNVDQVGKSQELFNVIKAYSLFDPDVGYTQGMIFITVPLIMNMTEAECFCSLVTLMKDYRIRELFCPEMKGLHLFLYEFDRLLETYSPLLYNHLVRQGIKSSMYASQWFLTFFAYKFPLDIVLRIYDILITQGSESILKFAVNLMIKNESNLLLLKFDNLLEYLKDRMFNVYVNEEYISASGDNSDLTQPSLTRRFSLLGSKRNSVTKGIQQAQSEGYYYKLDELVDDSMSINIDPIDLEKYEQEFENIYDVEASKLQDIKQLKIENGKLRKTIKQLEMKYSELNRDHVDIVQAMVDSKVTLPEILNDNEELELRISQLNNDIQDLESKIQSPANEAASDSGSHPSITSPVLPSSIENDINQLLLENAREAEKYAELEDEFNKLLEEDRKLTQELHDYKKQKWFGRWN